MKHTFVAEELVDRLDRAIAAAVVDISRRRARTLIADGAVFVDGKRCRVASRTIQPGVRVVVHTVPDPSEVDVPVLFEDDDILVVDKPPGIHVNETETSPRHSLEHVLADRNVHVVHRLDVDTTGVLLFAKSKRTAATISEAFAARAVQKVYAAITAGRPADGRIDAPIGPDRRRRAFKVHERGKPAITDVTAVAEAHGLAAVVARPETGRTHQIRVHLAHAGTPIVGDVLYGGPAAVRVGGEDVDADRPWLHAAVLSLEIGGKQRRFEAPIPGDIQHLADEGLSFDGAWGLASAP